MFVAGDDGVRVLRFGEREQVVVVGVGCALPAGGWVLDLLGAPVDRIDICLGAAFGGVLGELLAGEDVCELGDQRGAGQDRDLAIEDRLDYQGRRRPAGRDEG